MCSFIVLMPSVRIYNVNSHENKENTLNEKVCPNFTCIYIQYITSILAMTKTITYLPLVASSHYYVCDIFLTLYSWGEWNIVHGRNEGLFNTIVITGQWWSSDSTSYLLICHCKVRLELAVQKLWQLSLVVAPAPSFFWPRVEKGFGHMHRWHPIGHLISFQPGTFVACHSPLLLSLHCSLFLKNTLSTFFSGEVASFFHNIDDLCIFPPYGCSSGNQTQGKNSINSAGSCGHVAQVLPV